MMNRLKKRTEQHSPDIQISGRATRIPLRRRLAYKLSVRLDLLLLLILSILTVIIGYAVSNVVTKDADTNIMRTAAQNANLAANYLNTMQVRSDSLAKALAKLDGLNLDPEGKKLLVHEIMGSSLEDDRIFSVYTAWEPNAFFPDTPDGQSFYDYRDGSTIRSDVLNDYQTYRDGDYYATSKQTGKPHVTEPYEYTLTNGKTIWLITISNPIFSASGKFLGVANCDIQTDTINGLKYETGGYKNSFSYILSNGGTYLANTQDPSKMGSVYGADLQNAQAQEAAKQILNDVKVGKQQEIKAADPISEETNLAIYTPLEIQGVAEPLASAFVVPAKEAHVDTWKIVSLIIGLSIAALATLAAVVSIMLVRSLRPINGVVALAENLKNGKLDTELEVKSKDEFGHLTAVFRETSIVLKGYIGEISSVLATMASGDMRISLEHEYVGDFAPIHVALLKISDSLNQTLSKIGVTADQVNAGAEQVSAGAQALASGASEQAATVEELNATLSTVAEQARENARSVQKATEIVAATSSSVDEGNGYMQGLSLTMQQIGEASNKINGIAKAIEDIAFQTNILALNAAIEAARAGEAGKGFAVVADEVRNLAAKSAEAAKQAGDIIGQSSDKITEGIAEAEQNAQLLQDIAQKAAGIHEVILQIETASADQAGAIEQITQGLAQVSAVVQNNAATAQESSASSEELSAQANVLRQEVGKFRLAE